MQEKRIGMATDLRVVHYLNQFFGGIGGEEKADIPPQKKDGAVGPGRAINQFLGNRGNVLGTIFCGDNYVADHSAEAINEIVALIESYDPDILIAGPAFNAGRFGVACGAVCKAIQTKCNIPAVSGMFEENPGVDQYQQDIYIVSSDDNVKGMPKAIATMVDIACRLVNGVAIGRPEKEGYFPRNIIVNEPSEQRASDRAVEMLLAKIKGQPFESELELPKFDRVKPASLKKALKVANIALVTDGGLVLKGNPEQRPRSRSTSFATYEIGDLEALQPHQFEANHGGYHTIFVDEDPNRLVPLDALRELEKKGKIGSVHNKIYSTAGVATSLANCKKIGVSMVKVVQADGVDAVILTST